LDNIIAWMNWLITGTLKLSAYRVTLIKIRCTIYSDKL